MAKVLHKRLPASPLTVKMALFVASYLKSFDAHAAALEAGYAPSTAACRGAELTRHPEIAKAIAKAIEDRNARVLITADKVVRELGRIAFADPAAFFDATGELRPLAELTRDERAAIESVEVRENADGSISRKVRMHSKTRALELLAKHVGVLNDAAPSVNVGVAIQVISGVPRVPTDD